MHRRMPLLITVIFTLVAFAGITLAQECTAQDCVYLPAVQRAGANDQTATADAQTAIAIGTPLPTTCDDPLMQQGLDATAWLTSNTITPGDAVALCVKTNSQPQNATIYYVTHQRSGSRKSPTVPIANGGTTITRFALDTTQLGKNELITVSVFMSSGLSYQKLPDVYLLTR